MPGWSEPPGWLKWPASVVGLALAMGAILKFAGFERTTAEQKLAEFKAETRGYHEARDSSQRIHDSVEARFDSVMFARIEDLDQHMEDFAIGECTENTRYEMRNRIRLLNWCVRKNIPFKPESPP